MITLIQFSSVSQLTPTLCDPMDCSMPSLPAAAAGASKLLQPCPTLCDPIDSRPSCQSPTPRTCSNSYPSSLWCHPDISSCRLLFLPSIFPSIRIFSSESILPIRWPKYWSFCFSINPSTSIQDWFPLGLSGLISLQSRGFSRVFSNTTIQKHQFFGAQPSLWSNSHIHTWLLEKP